MPPARKRLSFDRRKSEAPWLAEYLRELTLFPAGRHDDQVNSTAQALAWIKSRPRAHGMAEHWRRMAEEGPGEAGGGGEAHPLTRKNRSGPPFGAARRDSASLSCAAPPAAARLANPARTDARGARP